MSSIRGKFWSLVAGTTLLSACGVIAPGTGGVDAGPACGTTGGPACTVTIKDFAYQPEVLAVAPGTVVTVKNEDSMVHTATSETGKGSFRAGPSSGVSFDTGDIAGGASGQFTVPASAPNGASVYYICTVHLQAMVNEPHLVIVK